MAQGTLTVGIIIVAVTIILSLILLKATPKDKYTGYLPSSIVAAAGFVFLFASTLLDVTLMGTPLGGWGIACLFSSAIAFIITSITDSYANAKA